jgi:hypothetical protein
LFSIERQGSSQSIEYCAASNNQTIISRKSTSLKVALGNYLQLRAGYLPGSIEITYLNPKRHFVFEDLQVQELPPAAELFAAPQGAREFETCEYPRSANFINPITPKLSLPSSGTARIFFHFVVGKDGSVSDLKIFSPAGSAAEEAGRKAVSQWRFSPATCDGHPIASEMDFDASLSPHP